MNNLLRAQLLVEASNLLKELQYKKDNPIDINKYEETLKHLDERVKESGDIIFESDDIYMRVILPIVKGCLGIIVKTKKIDELKKAETVFKRAFSHYTEKRISLLGKYSDNKQKVINSLYNTGYKYWAIWQKMANAVSKKTGDKDPEYMKVVKVYQTGKDFKSQQEAILGDCVYEIEEFLTKKYNRLEFFAYKIK